MQLPPEIRFSRTSSPSGKLPSGDTKGKKKAECKEDEEEDAAAVAAAKARAKGKGKVTEADEGKGGGEEGGERGSKAAAAVTVAAKLLKGKGKEKATDAASVQTPKPHSSSLQGDANDQGKGNHAMGNGAAKGDAQAGEEEKGKLRTLDIFAGCGGLSEGLERSGCCQTKWAIEYEAPAAEAFRANHPHATVFCANCNVVLR